ncbi:hypothetical protein BaRGS_00027783 [Batillaria attramentaria]|uniref:BZIP domain-containing protein n=1 Tax=Batillaria attramentaria TaxID=370345 RepID=A0ABD0K1Y2_9CAEN
MIKQYLSDGLLQIAILLSLFRTDLNSFYVPNNELLNYPEVQDILQGQTLAYLPTNFHNHYNTLNSIGGYPHPKHIDSDFYFSSLFRELREWSRFRQVSTHIEAFLVSDSTVGFPPAQTASPGPNPSTSSDTNNNAVEENGASAAQAHIDIGLQNVDSVDSNHNSVEGVVTVSDFNNNVTCHSPFPGCDLTKESLEAWAEKWGMRFNASKCYIMSLARQPASHFMYSLNDTILQNVRSNPYLGILFSNDMKWSNHICNMTKKANSTLGFLRRNLRHCPTPCKKNAYLALVRPLLEYGAIIWDPYLKQDADKMERIQRNAVRFISRDYRSTTPGFVTGLLKKYKLHTLQERREQLRLTFFFKVVEGLVPAIPPDKFLIPQKPGRRIRPRTYQSTSHTNNPVENYIRNNDRCFAVPRCNTEQYKQSFFPRTIIAWNRLDDTVVHSDSVECFKSALAADLDLIDVLWRQDVDLGVGKEVFDPNLRRELERERELELRKETEKRKEAEKRQRDRQQQAHQWLTQNFMRDGETGEWVPIAGTDNSAQFSPSGSQAAGYQELEQPGLTLPAASYPEQPLQAESFDANSLIAEAEKFSNFSQLTNESDQQTPTSTMNEMHILQHQQQMNMNNATQFTMMQEQGFSASASMNETCMLLQQNASLAESGLMADGGMLLHNATLPVPMDNVSTPVLDTKPLINDSGLASASSQYNASTPSQDTLSPLDWEAGELFFPNVTGLTNLTSAIASAAILDSSDLLPEFLPDEDLDMALNEGLQSIQVLDDAGSDSAVSMGSGSPTQEVNETMAMSPFDGLEGATGGSDFDSAASYSHQQTRTRSASGTGSVEDEGFHYSCSSYGSPASVTTNCSTGSNDTEHSSSQSATAMSHIRHNHTYPTQPGQTPREVKKYAKKDGPRQKGPASRDQKRAEELKIPFSFERIIGAPVEEFNDMITKTKLTEQQMSLMRDIRRRGKNKVAAQNCRKRKLNVLFNLEDDMDDLQRTRDKLVHERRQIDLQTRQAKDKYAALYDHIFRSLRDDHGRPYDPNEYSLQQSSDGNVFLVPRNCSTAISTPSSSGSSSNKRPSPVSKDKDSSEQKKKSRE